MIDGTVPDVSLVVIAFNERDRAPECVRSILDQQSDARFELVFVDDGSTDGTANVVTSAVAGDDRLRLIRLADNQGRGAARAAGVRAARGPLIGFVDADITLPRDWLRRCLAELPGRAGVSGIPVPDGDIAVLCRVTGATPRGRPGSMPITGSNVIFEAGILDQIGFDPMDRLGEDFRLANRLQRAGFKIGRVPGLTVRHDEQKSYRQALRWRYENGVDAATHPRELGFLRLADLAWLGWSIAWVAAVVGAIISSPWWLLAGPAAGAAAGVLHAIPRLKPRPLRPFLIACLGDIPLLTAYFIGRTVGAPRLISGPR